MKNREVFALYQIEIFGLASVLLASFLPRHFPKHSPKLPGFHLCFSPSSLKYNKNNAEYVIRVEKRNFSFKTESNYIFNIEAKAII